MLRRFWDAYAAHKRTALFVAVGSLVGAGLELAFPMAIRYMMNDILPAGFSAELLWLAGGLLLLYTLSYALGCRVEYVGHAMGAEIEHELRQKLFRHMLRLSSSFYDNARSGQLLSRAVSDISEIGRLMFAIPRLLTVCIVTMAGSTALLFWLNPLLASVVALLLSFKLYEAVEVNRRMKAMFMEARVKTGDLSGQLSESLQGIRLIKAFRGEDTELRKMTEAGEALLAVQRDSFRIAGRMHSGLAFFSNLTNLAVTVVGGLLISLGQMTFSDLVAFLLYMMSFMRPIIQIIMFTEDYQRGMAGFLRLEEIMATPESDEVSEGRVAELGRAAGDISFDHVSFGYNESARVFEDFSLRIAPGESVGIVGTSGGGKTTLCELLLGLYEPDGGSISVDGRDIRTLRIDSLRREIGMLQQDVFLFSASVRDNIAYGRPEATGEEIREAARLAEADGFIEALPDGYDTFVGERGVKLSGGEKQRIAIARMFLRDPQILILDEATSALDNETERQVQRAIRRLAENRTTITVAHRLATVRDADRILVLERGRIAEEGTHESLVRRQGLYYELYRQAA